MQLTMEMLDKDTLYGNTPFRPDVLGVLVPGRQGSLFCTYYKAGGPGKHPAVLLTHGFPGHEQSMDVAHALRRIGFHVMTLHYGGCWGSPGSYSFAGCIEDANCVLDYMRSTAELQIDLSNLFVVGHSVGGFVAGHLMARRSDLRAGVLVTPGDIGRTAMLGETDGRQKAGLLAALEEGALWLQGTDAPTLYRELVENGPSYSLASLGGRLAGKDLLLIGAALDAVAPVETNVQPLLDAILAIPHNKVQFVNLETDHYLTDCRLRLIELTAAFLLDHMDARG